MVHEKYAYDCFKTGILCAGERLLYKRNTPPFLELENGQVRLGSSNITGQQ
jgi:hypothetical protein